MTRDHAAHGLENRTAISHQEKKVSGWAQLHMDIPKHDDRLKGSLDSISKSSDGSAHSHEVNSRRFHNVTSNPTSLDTNVNRSVDNLDRAYLHPPSMGNTSKGRSKSSDRTFAVPAPTSSADVVPAQHRCTRATDELKRKYFENGLMPQGGPVYGSRSTSGNFLMTSAFHTSPQHVVRDRHGLRDVRQSSLASVHRPTTGAERRTELHAQAPQPAAHTHQQVPHNYGLTVSLASVKTANNSSSSSSQENSYRAQAHLLDTPSRALQQQRLSFQEQAPINLVSTRRRCFESDSNLHAHPNSTHSSPCKYPFTSSSPVHHGSQSNNTKYSSSHELTLSSVHGSTARDRSHSSTMSPRQVPEVPPAQLPMYLRSHTAAAQHQRSNDGQQRVRARSRSIERQDHNKAGRFYFFTSLKCLGITKVNMYKMLKA